MTAGKLIFRKEFALAALTASVGFFVLGYGAIRLTPPDSPTAIIWPANAFALCLLLRYARNWRERAAMLGGIFLADLCSNLLAVGSLALTIAYSPINTLELLLCLVMAGPDRPLRLRGIPAKIIFSLKVGVLPALLGGCAAMLTDGEVALFGPSATLEAARRRGCQLALLRRRIIDAAEAGCTVLFVWTGARAEDRPAGSYRNILRAGFEEAYLGANWRAETGSSG